MSRFRRAMMAAVKEAATETVLFKGSSLPNGLRCIRTFERVNGIAYDPFNESHRAKTRGNGVHEALFQRLRNQGVMA